MHHPRHRFRDVLHDIEHHRAPERHLPHAILPHNILLRLAPSPEQPPHWQQFQHNEHKADDRHDERDEYRDVGARPTQQRNRPPCVVQRKDGSQVGVTGHYESGEQEESHGAEREKYEAQQEHDDAVEDCHSAFRPPSRVIGMSSVWPLQRARTFVRICVSSAQVVNEHVNLHEKHWGDVPQALVHHSTDVAGNLQQDARRLRLALYRI